MKIGELMSSGDANKHCFGCGPDNEHGLRLTFTRTGEKTVEVEHTVVPHHCGAPNVAHGGIQASLLDEACGFACRTLFPDNVELRIVTAEFSLCYRRPVPTGEKLVVRGEVMRSEGRNIFIEGTIFDGEGNALTTCDARWVRLESA